MAKAKYPVGSIIRHKSHGFIAKIIERDSYSVKLEVLKSDGSLEESFHFYWNGDSEDPYYNGIKTIVYSPKSINQTFEWLGPAAELLYAK